MAEHAHIIYAKFYRVDLQEQERKGIIKLLT